MSRITSFLEWVLRLPLVWGGVAGLAFYASLSQGWIDSPMLTRYMAGHPVEYVTAAMFFVALAALGLRFVSLVAQFASVGRVTLGLIPLVGLPVSAADELLADLKQTTAGQQGNYLVRRLREALEYVCRKNSADALEQHLHHLEEQDAERMYTGYSLVRTIVWAIPVLGFLGTVIGITFAMTNLNLDALDAQETSTKMVTDGLGVAFDTTAQALAMTIVLMFVKFCIERMEDRLLSLVNVRATEELVGRFEYLGAESDPNVASIRRMTDQVVVAVEGLVSRQAELWRSTIDETHQQWADVSASTGKIINDSLTSSLNKTLSQHAERLNEGTQQHAERLSQNSTQSIARLREGLEKLAELLVEALHRHGEVLTSSEKALAEENRRHLSEVEAALGEAMVVSADRQESLIEQSEELLKQMQSALAEAADATLRQQEQLVKQGDLLRRVVDTAGQVTNLEAALNDNLATLNQVERFDEMTLSLTGAIQLLCARLGHIPSRTAPAVDAAGNKSASHAA